MEEKLIPLRLALPYIRQTLRGEFQDPFHRIALYDPFRFLFPLIELSGVPRGLPKVHVSKAGEHPELIVLIDFDCEGAHFLHEYALTAIPDPRRTRSLQDLTAELGLQSPIIQVPVPTFKMRFTAQRNGVGYSEKHATGTMARIVQTIHNAFFG